MTMNESHVNSAHTSIKGLYEHSHHPVINYQQCFGKSRGRHTCMFVHGKTLTENEGPVEDGSIRFQIQQIYML
jgi:hypothetical protein